MQAPFAPSVLGPLASPAAFDLVATSDGAVLAWAEPGACDTSLRVQRLDSEGRALGPARRRDLAPCAGASVGSNANVVEVALAAEAGRLGLTWIVEDDETAVLAGTHGADDVVALAPVQRIAEVAHAPGLGRGRVSLSASPTSHLRVAYQTPKASCLGRAKSCTHLLTQPFPSVDTELESRGGARELETPCASLLLGAAWNAGTWYDAFCVLDASAGGVTEPFAQVYAIRPEIAYAEAIETLRGCEPLGLSPAARGAVVWGRCDAGLRVHAITQGALERVLEPVERRARCVDGRPQLRAEAETGAITFALDEPTSQLQLWLPEAWNTSSPTRAVFTGRRLLVATASHAGLRLRRYTCRGDDLVPDE